MNKEDCKNKIVNFINNYDSNYYALNSKYILEELDYKIYYKKWKLNESLINYIKRYVLIRNTIYNKFGLTDIIQLNNVVNIYRYYDYIINQLYSNDKNKLNKFMNVPIEVIFKGYKFNVQNNKIISIGNPRFIKQLKDYTLNYISISHNDYYNLDENYSMKMYGGDRYKDKDDKFEYYHFIDFNYRHIDENPVITNDNITKLLDVISDPEDKNLFENVKDEINNNKLFYKKDINKITEITTDQDKLMNYYKLIKIAQNFNLLREKLQERFIKDFIEDYPETETITKEKEFNSKNFDGKIESLLLKVKQENKQYYPYTLEQIKQKIEQLINVFRAYNYCYSVLQEGKKEQDYNLEEIHETPEFDDRWINFEYQPTNLYYETEFVGGTDFDEILDVKKTSILKGGDDKPLKPEPGLEPRSEPGSEPYKEISMFNDLEITDSLIDFILKGYQIDLINFTVGQPNFINYMRSLTQFYFEPIDETGFSENGKYYSYRALLKPYSIIKYYFQNNIRELKEKQTKNYKKEGETIEYTYNYDNNIIFQFNTHNISHIQNSIIKESLTNSKDISITSILSEKIELPKEDLSEGKLPLKTISGGTITEAEGKFIINIDNFTEFKYLFKRIYNSDISITEENPESKSNLLNNIYKTLFNEITEEDKIQILLDPVTILMFNNNILKANNVSMFETLKDRLKDDKYKLRLIYMIKQINNWDIIKDFEHKLEIEDISTI